MSSSGSSGAGLLHLVRTLTTTGFVVSAGIGATFAAISGDWIVLPAMVLVWLFWRALPADDAPPGLHFSFSFHLVQIIVGVFYTAITDRYLTPHQAPQYYMMMVIAVACLAAMFVGFLLGDRWVASRRALIARVPLDVTLPQLMAAYAIALVSHDSLLGFVNTVPLFAQGIYALAATQMGMFYLLLRRLFRDQRHLLVLAVVAFETVRGFGGFYSSFKEPLILALIAGMEAFQPRKLAHWMLSVMLVGSMLTLSVVWLGIRGQIRADMLSGDVVRTQTERLEFAFGEFREWWKSEREYKMYDVDALVERVWDIYYAALALDRVPSVIPHEDGKILSAAFQHVLTPRFLNPDKPDLPSESEDVYRYTGLRVAGRDQGTTIAFGYAIQSYIDFGFPWFALPSLGFGIFLGIAYRFFMTTIRHEEILIAVLAVGFWANIMPYNTSWAKMMGKLLTSLVYIGGLAMIVDHFLYTSRVRRLGGVDHKRQPAPIR
jgi:hypothetical protein